MAKFVPVTNYHYNNSHFESDGVIYINPDQILYYRQVYAGQRTYFYPYYWVYLGGWNSDFRFVLSQEDLNKCLRVVGSPTMG